MQTLKFDIIVSKPAFDIKEGVFYDKIDGYIIKFGKKDKDGSTIHDILIYQHNYSLLQDNAIVAQSGKMTISADKKFLEFNLKNGWNYQEKGPRNSVNTQLIRMGFAEYKKVFDLSSFKLNKTDDSAFKNNYQMLNMRQLGTTIDSLEHYHGCIPESVPDDVECQPAYPELRWIVPGNPGLRLQKQIRLFNFYRIQPGIPFWKELITPSTISKPAPKFRHHPMKPTASIYGCT